MVRQLESVATAGAVATTLAPFALEPGLPFVGELLWPRKDVCALNNLLYWTVRGQENMALHFPEGTVVGVKRVTRRMHITPGLYVWHLEGIATMLLRVTRMASRGLYATFDNLPEGQDFLMDLYWNNSAFALYRVTHYVSIGEQSKAAPAPKKARKLTAKQAKQMNAQERIFEEAGALVTMQFPNSEERREVVVSHTAALVITQLIISECEVAIAKATALIAKNNTRIDAIQTRLLLTEARQLVKKGGAVK